MLSRNLFLLLLLPSAGLLAVVYHYLFPALCLVTQHAIVASETDNNRRGGATVAQRPEVVMTTSVESRIGRSGLWVNYTRGIIDCSTGKMLRMRPPYNPQHRGSLERGLESGLKEGADARQTSFNTIFMKKIWGGDKKGRIYGSGPGSTVPATATIRRLLGVVLDQLKVVLGKDRIRMLDIPCGDMAWMPILLRGRTDIDYTGMDIVPTIVQSHRDYFHRNKTMRFIHQDIVQTPLEDSYDFVFTRQMTQHLTTHDTIKVLKHISDSGSSFLMATTASGMRRNTELGVKSPGRFRLQNFVLAPYWLENPVCYGPERGGQPDVMALWELPFAKHRTNT